MVRRVRKGLENKKNAKYVKKNYSKPSYTGTRAKLQKNLFLCNTFHKYGLISKFHIQAPTKHFKKTCFYAKTYENIFLFQNFTYMRPREKA